jgi:hypothetical protein
MSDEIVERITNGILLCMNNMSGPKKDIARSAAALSLQLLREPTDWQPMETAPHDQFIMLWCPEDNSRWLAKWQGDRWYGVDDMGFSRQGASEGDPNVVTGWFVRCWVRLPNPPCSITRVVPDAQKTL